MILLGAGHYPESPGACYPADSADWCEHAEAVRWVTALAFYLKEQAEPCVIYPPSTLVRKVAFINEQRPTLAVEIHFNSDPSGKGKGSETLYCPNSSKGRVIANMAQGPLGSMMSPNRGVKEGWYRMDRPGHDDYPGDVDGDEKPDYFLTHTVCPALIIEPEFIHNRAVIEASRDTVCEVLAGSLIAAARFLRGEA